MKQRLLAWIRYLRLPNVLTIPGDVLAGAALAGGLSREIWTTVLGVCLAYLFGMALNDLTDRHLDRRERPERPLPSGRISLRAARTACIFLALAAFVSAPSKGMMILLITIVAYTNLKERMPRLGAAQMGFCRMLAVWIGAGQLVPTPLPLTVALLWWGLFIFCVTRIASFETRPDRRTRMHLLIPPLMLLGTGTLLLKSTGFPLEGLIALGLLTGSCRIVLGIERADGSIQPSDIGRFLGLLFFMQAFVLVQSGQLVTAGVVLALAPLLRLLRKRIPAS